MQRRDGGRQGVSAKPHLHTHSRRMGRKNRAQARHNPKQQRNTDGLRRRTGAERLPSEERTALKTVLPVVYKLLLADDVDVTLTMIVDMEPVVDADE